MLEYWVKKKSREEIKWEEKDRKRTERVRGDRKGERGSRG